MALTVAAILLVYYAYIRIKTNSIILSSHQGENHYQASHTE